MRWIGQPDGAHRRGGIEVAYEGLPSRSSDGNAEAYVCAGAVRHEPDATSVGIDDGARNREPEAC